MLRIGKCLNANTGPGYLGYNGVSHNASCIVRASDCRVGVVRKGGIGEESLIYRRPAPFSFPNYCDTTAIVTWHRSRGYPDHCVGDNWKLGKFQRAKAY